MSKAIVLLSGGQDSTTCLYWARTEFDEVEAVSFRYAQRHHAELEAAGEIAALARVRRTLLDVMALNQIGDSALTTAQPIRADGGYVDHDSPQGLPTTFVPGRNLIFLSTAAAFAARYRAEYLIIGVSQADYSGYPDCREDFIDKATAAIAAAMPSSVKIWVRAPLLHFTKAQTVQKARELRGCWDALALSITCYEGRRPGCGQCSACVIRARGFADAGEVDPACA